MTRLSIAPVSIVSQAKAGSHLPKVKFEVRIIGPCDLAAQFLSERPPLSFVVGFVDLASPVKTRPFSPKSELSILSYLAFTSNCEQVLLNRAAATHVARILAMYDFSAISIDG